MGVYVGPMTPDLSLMWASMKARMAYWQSEVDIVMINIFNGSLITMVRWLDTLQRSTGAQSIYSKGASNCGMLCLQTWYLCHSGGF